MARYRIRWRNILRRLPLIILLMEQMRFMWPEVKSALEDAVVKNPDIADFIAVADEVYRTVVQRRR